MNAACFDIPYCIEPQALDLALAKTCECNCDTSFATSWHCPRSDVIPSLPFSALVAWKFDERFNFMNHPKSLAAGDCFQACGQLCFVLRRVTTAEP